MTETTNIYILGKINPKGQFEEFENNPFAGCFQLTPEFVKTQNAAECVIYGSAQVASEKGSDIWPPDTYQWVRWKNKNWATDAQRKIDARAWKRPFWHDEIGEIEGHFAHTLDKGDEIVIQFYSSKDKAEVDIKTEMKPGRYLTKFFPKLSKDDINRLACDIDRAKRVKFTTNGAEIAKVYTSGVSSCMGHPTTNYMDRKNHPTMAYDGGDLQVAFLSVDELDDPNFRVTARALVWPAKKIHGRIYGDNRRLKAALEKEGYSEGSLTGARMRKQEITDNPDHYLMPFVDYTHNIYHDDTDEGFVINRGKRLAFLANITNGGVKLLPKNKKALCPFLGIEYLHDGASKIRIYDLNINIHPSLLENIGAWSDAITGNYYSQAQQQFDTQYGPSTMDAIQARNMILCCKTKKFFNKSEMIMLRDTQEYVDYRWANKNAYRASSGSNLYYSSKEAYEQAETNRKVA